MQEFLCKSGLQALRDHVAQERRPVRFLELENPTDEGTCCSANRRVLGGGVREGGPELYHRIRAQRACQREELLQRRVAELIAEVIVEQ